MCALRSEAPIELQSELRPDRLSVVKRLATPGNQLSHGFEHKHHITSDSTATRYHGHYPFSIHEIYELYEKRKESRETDQLAGYESV